MIITPKLSLVLDTNVCLDLFVYNDPRCFALRKALIEKRVIVFTEKDCKNEWLRVLDYPKLSLSEEQKRKAIHQFDNLITEIVPKKSIVPLPMCRDEDDQKFLELARDISANYLITKDKALLKLNGKTKKSGLFSIIRPEVLVI